MGDEATWWTALLFGTLMVFVYSWSRFDEPAGNEQLNYLYAYRPRFHTTPLTFRYAKFGYLGIIVTIFVGLCFSPQLINLMGSTEFDANDPAVPLAFAVALTSLQNVILIKDLEQRLRGFLHSIARIPHSVRRTIAQMRSAGFNFNLYRTASGAKWQAKRLPLEEIDKYVEKNGIDLYREDDVLRPWYRVGCLLHALDDKNLYKLNIDPVFIEEYRDELESIRAHHNANLVDVDTYVRGVIAAETLAETPSPDESFVDNLRKNRDRLYAFLACGLLSNVRSRRQVQDDLRQLGFVITRHGRPGFPIWDLISFSFIATIIATVVTTGATRYFESGLPEVEFASALPVDDVESEQFAVEKVDWKKLLRIPPTDIDLLLFSWKTALFYFSAMLSAIAARQSYIAKRRWFDIRSRDREKPFFHYTGPVILGTFTGWTMLSLIILSDMLQFGPSVGEQTIASLYKLATEAMKAALHWMPLAMIMSGIALFIADSEMRATTSVRIVIRTIVCSAAMGLMGYAVFRIGAPDFSDHPKHEIIAEYFRYYNILLSVFIALFVMMLYIALQVVEQKHLKNRNFSGKRMRASNSRGLRFFFELREDQTASVFEANEKAFVGDNAIGKGYWKQIPEGTVINWDRNAESDVGPWGELGIITLENDTAIYEGYHHYNTASRGNAEYVGQLEILEITSEDDTN